MATVEGGGRALLVRLLQSCAELAHLAGETIRAVQREREQPQGGGGGGSAALGATLKDAGDDRSYLTTADLRAQKVIVDGLRAQFPALSLVGEEDEAEEGVGALADPASWLPDAAAAAGCVLGVAADGLPAELDSVALAELVVFIDPVDGTREFVQGRLEACQTLIGISWRGRAIAGVVGLPFHDPAKIGSVSASPPSTAAGVILSGIVGVGVFGLPAAEGASRTQLVCASSKTVKEDVLVKAHAIVGGETLVAGGCGNKILRLLLGEADVTLFNLGTSLWDTCATEALLVASGGVLTTLLGTPVEHTAAVPTPNRLGVVATASTYTERSGKTHRELCAALVQDLNTELAELVGGGLVSAGGQQALDIVRSIDGQPFTASELGELLGCPGAISAFSCPESGSVRYKQSVAARVMLVPTEAEAEPPPASFFYKRVSCHDIAGIWVAFFSRCQRYCC